MSDERDIGKDETKEYDKASYTSANMVTKDESSANIDGTRLMQAMLEHTLASYPPHYQAALRALLDHPFGQGDYQCVGAAETGLSEDGMTVAFDFRCQRPAWRRMLVKVTMSFGEVVNIEVQRLQAGEHSGIAILDQVAG